MSVYISKNAINNIPLAEDSVGDSNGGKLQSLLLSSNQQLIGIAKNDTSNSPLKIGMENEAVNLIKVALNFINERDSIYPEYIIIPLDVNSYLFDDKLQDAIIKFQDWAGIAPIGSDSRGKIDSETLLSIDSKISGDDYFDAERKKYIGSTGSRKVLYFKQKQSLVNDKYTYSGSFSEDSKVIEIETDSPISGEIVRKGFIDSNGKAHIVPSNESLKEILNNPNAKKAVEEKSFLDGQKPVFQVKAIDTKIIGTNFTDIPVVNYNSEEENTPPLLFEDKDAKLHKIVAGDTPTNIVLNNYYGSGEYTVKNPYGGEAIYKFPEREAFPEAIRSEDARFQFYLNLIYYYNSEKIGDEPVKEWGITTANGYERYSVNHLDNVNIFDNTFDASVPETGLPNYYRFLKQMENKNLASKIQFDSEGNATSFATVEGKNIRIPSRKFADSMYNLLNFRHNEMLVPIVIPGWLGADPKTKMEYITEEALDLVINGLSTAMDGILNLPVQVKNYAIALYKETVAFFKKAYNFAITSLTKYWPRGLGGAVGVDLSITWGIPINTRGSVEKNIYRKMSKDDELTIVYSSGFSLGIGFDLTEGLGGSLGFNNGIGKSKKKFGIDFGAEVHGGVDVKVATEYEFPIKPDETTLLTMIVTVFGGVVAKSLSEVLTKLDVLNLDPRQYITKMDVAYEKNVGASLRADLNRTDQNRIKPETEPDSEPIQEKSKLFGYIDNIFNKLPSASFAGEQTSGIGFTYIVDYGDNPFNAEHDARVFEKIEIEVKYFVHKVFGGNISMGIWSQIFAGLTGLGTIANGIIDALSFDKGKTLGFKYKLERKSKPGAITKNDFSFLELLNPNSKAITYGKSTDKVEKTLSMFFSSFTGDVDTLCEPGTEVRYNINMGVLKDMLFTDYNYTFDNVIKLFSSIEYHKKVGFVYDKSQSKKIDDKGFSKQALAAYGNKGDAENNEIELISAIFKEAQEKKGWAKFLSLGLALDVKMKIEFDDEDMLIMKNMLEYYIRKLYLKYLRNNTNIEKLVKDQKDNIDNAIKNIPRDGNKPEMGGKEYYELLYSDALIPNSTTVKGLLGYIKDVPTDGTVNYLNVIELFIDGIDFNDMYLNDRRLKKSAKLDYGIEQFIHAFGFMTELLGLEVTLEGKIGGTFGLYEKIGGGLLTESFGLSASAEVTFQPKLYENGALTKLYTTDAMYYVFKEIEKILGLPNTNKRIGAKTVFGVLPK